MLLLHKPTAFLFLLIMIFESTSTSSIDFQPTYNGHYCLGAPNDTAGTNFISNLSALFSSLSSKSTLNSFYNDSASNEVYGLYLCGGDVSIATCQFCVETAIQEIQQQCPSNKSAIIWYDLCTLRYSDTKFFGLAETSPGVIRGNTVNTSSPNEPNYGAQGLINTLTENVPYTEMMYGTDESGTGTGGSQQRYAMVQCTRDLNTNSCLSCLRQLRVASDDCCQSRIGWHLLAPSCNMRYEQTLFWVVPSTPPTPVTAAPQPDNGN